MLNRVTLIGRLTKDLELTTSNGKQKTYFTLAVNSFSNNQVEFIPCIAWDKNAENMSKYLKKGSLIYVEGRLHLWKNEQTNVIVPQVNVSMVLFMNAKNDTSYSNDNFSKTSSYSNQQVKEQDFDINSIDFNFINENKIQLKQDGQEIDVKKDKDLQFIDEDQAIVWD